MVFNVGEIAMERFYVLRFCDLQDLRGNFCRLKLLQFGIDSKKSLFDTLEPKCFMHFRLHGS